MSSIPSCVSYPSHHSESDAVSMISMDDSCGSALSGEVLNRRGSAHSCTYRRSSLSTSDQTVLPQISERSSQRSADTGLPSVPRRRGSLVGSSATTEDYRPVQHQYDSHRKGMDGSCRSQSAPPRFPRRRGSLTFVSEEDLEKPYDQVVGQAVQEYSRQANSSPPGRVKRRPSLVASQAA